MINFAYDCEWDGKKADSNWKKHHVSFEQAATVFFDTLSMTVFDREHSEYEDRWFTVGSTSDGALLAVSHTYQATSASSIRIRIISARPATKQERRFYADNPR